MEERTTQNNITELQDNEVFVFGSNMAGRHGKGAAKTALKWGAKYGKFYGLHGKTYAIPTVSSNIRSSLDLEKIQLFVNDFIDFASENQEKVFLVTEIGCGLAVYTPKDIAPLFSNAANVDNIHLPFSFWEELNVHTN
jgi:hypothetical protein